MDTLIKYLEKYFYSKKGLIIGHALIAVIFLIFFQLNTFKNIYILIILIISLITFTIFWIYFNSKMPKNLNDKIGIVIALKTENSKQRVRVKKDLAENVLKLLEKYNLMNFNIIVPSEFQTNRINDIIVNSFKKYRERRISNNQKISKEEKIWKKLRNKIGAHFYLYGEVCERLEGENRYLINFNAVVLHKKIDLKLSDEIAKEIRSVLPNVSFEEKKEITGFKFTSNVLYLAARYIVGVAALVSGNSYVAYNIHKDLKEQFIQALPGFPNISNILNNLKKHVSQELYIMSRTEYFIKRNIPLAREYLKKSREADHQNYLSIIFMSYIAFDVERNFGKALSLIEKGKRLAGQDRLWIYNRAFLLIYSGKYKNALNELQDLAEDITENEKRIILQCIEYDINLYKKEPDKKQLLFIIGYLYYKRLGNIPEALDYFEKFIEESKKNIEEYYYLIKKANVLLKDIRNIMGL